MLLVEIKTQEQLNDYIKNFSLDNECMFMIKKAIDFCGCKLKCKYQGLDRYTLRMGRKRECKRTRAIELMKLLR